MYPSTELVKQHTRTVLKETSISSTGKLSWGKGTRDQREASAIFSTTGALGDPGRRLFAYL